MPETFTASEVRQHLENECAEAGSQKAWAALHGLSAAYVNDVVRGRKDPGDGIAGALGLRRIVLYADAGQISRQETRHGEG